jgi:hypothetical protein
LPVSLISINSELGLDSPLHNDHNAMKKLVKSREILEEVEKVIGALG